MFELHSQRPVQNMYGIAVFLLAFRTALPYISCMDKAPVHTVVATLAFQKRVKALDVNEAELNAIYDLYQSQPGFGKIEPRIGGLRKGRVAKAATGKSGGYRVFSFFADEANPVFQLWMIDKTDDDSLTGEQKNAFKAALAKLKKELKK